MPQPPRRLPSLDASAHTPETLLAHVRALMPSVLELISSGALNPEVVTTTVAPIEDAPSVLREHFLAGRSVKTVLTA